MSSRSRLRWVFWGTFGTALLACTGETTDEATNCDAAPDIQTMSLTSDRDGLVEIPVTIDADDVAMQVIVQATSGYVSTEMLIDESGDTVLDWQDWSSSNESLTDAFYAAADATTLNWPVRDGDNKLAPGDWTVYASTLTDDFYYSGNEAVGVTVVRRNCTGASAELKATIAYAGNLSADSTVTNAMETAADRWKEIYAGAGIALDIEFADANLNASLPEPAAGSQKYADLYDELGGEGIVVVVGDDVAGYSDLYGMAGGIPGPQLGTQRSIVALAWLIHAGANATFSDAELELLAETMAHEVGHYLGLYHPVETGWNYWDALSDTDQCQSTNNCEKALGDNLMFPYPVCAGASCTEQSVLTNDQAGVIGNYVGVR